MKIGEKIIKVVVEKIQCNEMTGLIEKVRKGEDEDEDRSCDQKGLQWSKVHVQTVEKQMVKEGRGSER